MGDGELDLWVVGVALWAVVVSFGALTRGRRKATRKRGRIAWNNLVVDANEESALRPSVSSTRL